MGIVDCGKFIVKRTRFKVFVVQDVLGDLGHVHESVVVCLNDRMRLEKFSAAYELNTLDEFKKDEVGISRVRRRFKQEFSLASLQVVSNRLHIQD